jgi:hypothetical protein
MKICPVGAELFSEDRRTDGDTTKLIVAVRNFANAPKMFQTQVLEKLDIHILCSPTFFPKIMPFMRKMEKFCRARQATYGRMARAHC